MVDAAEGWAWHWLEANEELERITPLLAFDGFHKVSGKSMNLDDYPREELVRMLAAYQQEREQPANEGIVMTYQGRSAPWQIIRQVKPKMTAVVRKLCCGDETSQAKNMIVEGENLSAMVTLFKYRGQVDLVLTDPPYNTGEDFRYNDKWDEDPNDPDLGTVVSKEDGSRHSKWLRFMTPRLWMMKEMLKPWGVIAICIDERELFRLGMLMDEIFREENRIGIINWQKAYAPKSDTGGKKGGVSSATEYVLVYAKDLDKAKTDLLPRTDSMDAKYKNPDGDPIGDWRNDNLSAQGSTTHPGMVYAIQNPFTGELHYPPDGRHWASEKTYMREWLEGWGSKYVERKLNDKVSKALLLDGFQPEAAAKKNTRVLERSRSAAMAIQERGAWPRLYFGMKGQSGPQVKRYMEHVKKGLVPLTYWADDDYDSPFILNNQSWDHEQSGHSQTGVRELVAVVGEGHNFKTVKPLKLFKKIIQIWCRSEGLILDPFAGSGTTAQAILELNADTDSKRKFILIEQGNSPKGDPFARSLTVERVKRTITGKWASGKHKEVPGGFRFIHILNKQINGKAVVELQREEMIDLLLTSYWDKKEKAESYLTRFGIGENKYLFGKNARGDGFYLVWEGPDKPSVLDRAVFNSIVAEGEKAKVNSTYHVYARVGKFVGGSLEFYKIPDRVLEHIGFSQRTDAFATTSSTNGEEKE